MPRRGCIITGREPMTLSLGDSCRRIRSEQMKAGTSIATSGTIRLTGLIHQAKTTLRSVPITIGTVQLLEVAASMTVGLVQLSAAILTSFQRCGESRETR